MIVHKKSKRFLGQEQVENLGHIITQQGVATDPSKVAAMLQWVAPMSIKGVERIPGLTVYYRKFVQGVWSYK